MSNIELFMIDQPERPNRADILKLHDPIETSYKKSVGVVLNALSDPANNMAMLLEDGPTAGAVYLDEIIKDDANLPIDGNTRLSVIGHLEVRNKKDKLAQMKATDFDGSLDHPDSKPQLSWRRMDGVEFRIKMPSERKVRFLGKLGLEAKAQIAYRRDWFVDPTFLKRRGAMDAKDVSTENEGIFAQLAKDWDDTTQSFRSRED